MFLRLTADTGLHILVNSDYILTVYIEKEGATTIQLARPGVQVPTYVHVMQTIDQIESMLEEGA